MSVQVSSSRANLLLSDVPGRADLLEKLSPFFAIDSRPLSIQLAQRVIDESYDAFLLDFDWDPVCASDIVAELGRFNRRSLPPVIAMCDPKRSLSIATASGGLVMDSVDPHMTQDDIVARIRSNLPSATAATESSRIRYGDLVIDRAQYRMWCGDDSINLSAYQFRLLDYLMTNPETVFTRAELLDAVWPKATSEEAVSACVARLRRLLKPYGKERIIRSVVGGGYALDALQGRPSRP